MRITGLLIGCLIGCSLWPLFARDARAESPGTSQGDVGRGEVAWQGRTSGSGAQSLSSVCPMWNLLAGRRPLARNVSEDLAQLTDDVATPEGAIWNTRLAVILDTQASTITCDLGAEVPIEAVYVQADANDQYHVWGSRDGVDYRLLGRIDTVSGHGLRGRTLGVGGVAVRYLRIGEGVGDGYYSLSEVQAFCRLPTPFPPKLRVKDAPPAVVAKTLYTYWNNDASARWQLVLGLLAFGLLAWEINARRGGRLNLFPKLRDRLFMALGLVSVATYFNFGFFRFPNYWDTFHYYVGAKYSRELGYDRLYECVAIADAEDPLLRRQVELRKVTNLRTNVLETTAGILKHPERCKDHFTAARWLAFKHDVAYFRSHESAKRWDDAQTDHGYNGTPVWNVVGSMLANLAPASQTQIVLLNLLDPAYFFSMVAVVWWAFGWRVSAVALAVFATNFPSRFHWAGGSFLRWDWLFYLVATICCLKKGKPVLGGMALAYATLLRIFPGFLVIGPVLAFLYRLVRRKEFDRTYLRFFAGGVLAVAIAVPVSFTTGGGPAAYSEFVRNTIKHKETPLTNYMGLRTVVAYRPDEVGRLLRDEHQTDPWGKWKEARLRGFRQSRPLYLAAILASLVMLGAAVRNVEPWAAAALSATFIAIGVELTCYYYAFLIAVALLCEIDARVGRLLLLLTAATQFVAWAPLSSMATWLDEQYTLMSVCTLVAFAIILWAFGFGGLLQGAASARVAFDGPSAPSPSSAEPLPPSGRDDGYQLAGQKGGQKQRKQHIMRQAIGDLPIPN